MRIEPGSSPKKDPESDCCAKVAGMQKWWSRQKTALKKMECADMLQLILTVFLFLPFEWLAAAAACLFLGLLLSGRLWPVMKEAEGIGWFLGYGAIGLAASIQTHSQIGILSSLGIFLIAVLLAGWKKIVTPVRFTRFLRHCTLLSWFAAAVGIAEYFAKASACQSGHIFDPAGIAEGSRVASTFYNPNLYAAMIIFILISCMYLFLETVHTNRNRRLFYVVSALLNLFMLLLTGCRAALVPLPFIIPLFLYFHHKENLFKGCVGAESTFVLFTFFCPEWIPRLEQKTSVLARLEVWKTALQFIPKKPLIGGGPQYYGMISQSVSTHKAPHAHNFLIDSLLSFGLLGTACILIYIGRQTERGLSDDVSKVLPSYKPLLVSVLVAAALMGLVDCTLNFLPTAMYFFVLITAPVPAEKIKQSVISPCV